MVSKTILAMFVGQVLIALLLMYLLPLPADASKSSDAPAKINRKSRPIITTKYGEVRGSLHPSYSGQKYFAQFLGIPYAEKPLGALRFSPPKALVSNWNGTVREATKQPPKCLQLDETTGEVVGSEDCLVLNIYASLECCNGVAPSQAGTSKQCPVMVWLHPGDFSSQDGSPEKFGPQLLMDQNVVLVSVNYRLGPMGFLSFESNEAPGNVGLQDQALALQWIKQEASNFCGDSSRVTIFGSGSGATSAILQMISPQNRGKNLFNGVIAQSGSPIYSPMFDIKDRKNATLNLAKDLGCKQDVLKCLKHKVDPTSLMAAAYAKSKAYAHSWLPMVDKVFIPEAPHVLLKSMKNTGLQAVILGHNTQEGVEKVAPILQNPTLFSNFTATLPEMIFGPHGNESRRPLEKSIIRVLKRAYIPDGRTTFNNLKYATNLVADYAFTGSVATTVELLTQFQPQIRTYFYQYGFSGTQSVCDKSVYYGWRYSIKLQLQNLGLGYNMRHGHGICRGDEMFPLFIFHQEPPPVNGGPLTNADKKMSQQMTQMWTDFARTTFPTPTAAASSPSDESFHWAPTENSSKRFASMKTTQYKMASDELYWTRVHVYQSVQKLLQSKAKDDMNLQQIEKLIRDQLMGNDVNMNRAKNDL